MDDIVEHDPSNDNGPPSETKAEKPKKTSTMHRYLTFRILNKIFLIFFGYLIAYMEWSYFLIIIAIASMIWLENLDNHKGHRIHHRAHAASYSKQDLMRKIDEIPGWVMFPDRERAEWLNQIIAQLWPTLNNYVIKIFRQKIQTQIRKKHESFRFDDIDFGCTPPKIDGVKVYNNPNTKDSIIIDFDVFYDGNCDINFSVSGAQMGGIRDFQMSVEIRVVLKPILAKMPLVGGIQVFFLNTPDITFNLEGISGIPGLSTFIRTKIEEKLTKWIVFPNKVTKRFAKSVEAAELKAIEPAGVLRVHVFEAKKLMAKDITGKSDPYVILYLGAQEYKTQIINQDLNPKWDYWCEFIVLDPMSQHIGFKLFDHDNVNDDDFLGDGDVDIGTILKGETDQLIKLRNAKSGELHLRFTWLSLTSDKEALESASRETKLLRVSGVSTAVLSAYVDSARNLPSKSFKKPHAFFTIMVSNRKQKSKIKKHTNDPAWEQGFVFLVGDPMKDAIYINIEDKESGSVLDKFVYNVKELMEEPGMQINKQEFPLSVYNPDSKIILSLQLKILSNELFEAEDDSESESEDTFSRQNSMKSNRTSANNSPLRQSPITEEGNNQFVKKVSTFTESKPLLRRNSSLISQGKHRLGRIELTLEYSDIRQKFGVTIHKISNLPMKDASDIPDPYVKVKLTPGGDNNKNKTDMKIDECDPVFEETFEYLMSKHEVHQQTLFLTVKTKKKLFTNNVIGEVVIDLAKLIIEEPHRAWHDICPEE